MYVCIKLHVHMYVYLYTYRDIQHPIQKCVHHWIYGVICTITSRAKYTGAAQVLDIGRLTSHQLCSRSQAQRSQPVISLHTLVPSGKRLHNYGKIHHFYKGKLTYQWAIFHSYCDMSRY